MTVLKKRSYIIGLGVFLLATLAAGGWYYASRQTKAPVTKTATVTRGDIITAVSATGTIVPVDSVNIGSKITGTISEMRVQENQPVKEGDILCVLDDLRYQAQVKAARAQLNRSVANLAQLEAGSRPQEVIRDQSSLRRTESKLQNARMTLERRQQLFALGAISHQDLDTAQTDYDAAEADYQTAVQQLSMTREGSRAEQVQMARAQVEQDEANLENEEASLRETVIRAPMSGVVVGKPMPKGQTVQVSTSTAQVIMQLADLTQMQVEALVDETDIGRIREGQDATFTVDAYPGKQFTGKVTRISSAATTQQNVVFYTVTVQVDNREGLLKPTMTARVTIQTGRADNVLMVPNNAVKDRNGVKTVQILRDGKTVQQKVKIGLNNDETVEITEGLQEGDVVVISSVAGTNSQRQGGGMMPLRIR
ncbi:MAG TPA: efflux RND transporter periplasmic adaptor subunit [Negativicutes bacterium]|nr:efflux RND transporter periplasmic adaptor subunit [Negativicutes bacterium]